MRHRQTAPLKTATAFGCFYAYKIHFQLTSEHIKYVPVTPYLFHRLAYLAISYVVSLVHVSQSLLARGLVIDDQVNTQ
jgi:hypothetical protein